MQETTKRAFVKFAPNTDGFWPELKKEVDTYFKDNNITPLSLIHISEPTRRS